MSQLIKITADMFLDEKKLFRAEDRFAGFWLNKAGAFTRAAAKRSMRKGTKNRRVSEPGKPPLWHTGKLRRSIMFATNMQRKVVNIGPQYLIRSGTAFGAELLEFGGQTLTNAGPRTYEARPFMEPALVQAVKDLQNKHADEIPKAWRAAVTQVGG